MRTVLLCGLILSLGAGLSLAFAPQTLSFQGRLTDSGGINVADGNHSVTFRVYSQLNGGAPLWTSTRQVTVNGGVFAVILGEINPLNLPFDQLYYVGVQYEAEPEMAPRVPLTATPYALAVSPSAAVTSLNGLTGPFNLVAGSNVSINPVGGNLVISATGAVADNDWTVTGSNMYAIPSGSVGIGTSSPNEKLQVVGNVLAGDGANQAFYGSYNSGGYLSDFGGDAFGEGSGMHMFQEDGSVHTFIEPDVDGDGSFLQIYGSTGNTAFQVDGAFAGGAPRISMIGTSSAVFALGSTGNASVQLPASSISAGELENEPGIASRNDHATSSYAVQTSYNAVTSRTIVAPTGGYIVASASLEIELNHQGSSCYVTAGLSLSPTSLPDNQDLSFYLPTGAAQGLYLSPSTPTAIFPVSAGSTTVYLVALRSGTTDAVIWDAQLNLLFVPTAYGTVALADANDDGRQADNDRVSRPATSSDLALEARQSEQDNQARIDRELSELRAQVEALKAEVDGRTVNGRPRDQR
ncbi:MAG: hypothetical protein R3D98_09115 [Candidatus Krumholzibacteriia bacterium]